MPSWGWCCAAVTLLQTLKRPLQTSCNAGSQRMLQSIAVPWSLCYCCAVATAMLLPHCAASLPLLTVTGRSQYLKPTVIDHRTKPKPLSTEPLRPVVEVSVDIPVRVPRRVGTDGKRIDAAGKKHTCAGFWIYWVVPLTGGSGDGVPSRSLS